MSDLKVLEQALSVAAQQGDVEAARAITADMQRLIKRGNPSIGMPEPAKIGQAGMRDSIRSVVRSGSRPEQVFAGIGAAPALAWHGLTGQDNTNPDVQNWRAVAGASGDTIGGNLLGNVLQFGAAPTRAGPLAAGVAKVPAWLTGRMGSIADTAATSGALNYATTPGTHSERMGDAGLAALVSPLAPALYAMGAGTRRAVTRQGKQIAVGEGMLAEAGPNAENIISGLKAADPGAAIGVASSSAMKTQNPMLEALESGARAKRGDLWRDFDKKNAKARWDALVSKAGTQEELEGMQSALSAKTGGLRQEALSDAQLTTIFSQSGDVTKPMLKSMNEKIADWRFSLRPNKEVQKLANYVENELRQGVTPEQLYEVRKTLTDGIKPGRNDELSNAIKSSRKQSVEMVKLIDDSLNTLSGGGWKEYLSKHSAGMKPIESKQALQDVVSSLERGMPTGVVPPAMGESPAWKTVGNLRDRFGQKELGSKTVDTLLPEDKQLLDNVVDSLKRQSDTMQAKGVLGSHTAALLANAGRAEGVTRNIIDQGVNKVLPFGSVISSKVFDKLGRQAEEELARLLQDPNALAEALARALMAQKVKSGASRVGAASGGAVSGQ